MSTAKHTLATCTTCKKDCTSHHLLCDEVDGKRCPACFAKTACGRGKHGEGCATQVFDDAKHAPTPGEASPVTPTLPWRYEHDGGIGGEILGKDDWPLVAMVLTAGVPEHTRAALGRFIIRACNSHDALVAALEAFEKWHAGKGLSLNQTAEIISAVLKDVRGEA